MGSCNETKDTNFLTAREFEVLRLIMSGKTNRVIADELVITRHTVKAHISSILKKFGVKTRLEAAIFAIKNDVIK